MSHLLEAPCAFCGYNGPEYWQAGSHAIKCPWHKVGGSAEREAKMRNVMAKWMPVAIRHAIGNAIDHGFHALNAKHRRSKDRRARQQGRAK